MALYLEKTQLLPNNTLIVSSNMAIERYKRFEYYDSISQAISDAGRGMNVLIESGIHNLSTQVELKDNVPVICREGCHINILGSGGFTTPEIGTVETDIRFIGKATLSCKDVGFYVPVGYLGKTLIDILGAYITAGVNIIKIDGGSLTQVNALYLENILSANVNYGVMAFTFGQTEAQKAIVNVKRMYSDGVVIENDIGEFGKVIIQNAYMETVAGSLEPRGVIAPLNGSFGGRMILSSCILKNSMNVSGANGVDGGSGGGHHTLIGTAIVTTHATSYSVTFDDSLQSIGSVANKITDTCTETVGTLAIDADLSF